MYNSFILTDLRTPLLNGQIFWSDGYQPLLSPWLYTTDNCEKSSVSKYNEVAREKEIPAFEERALVQDITSRIYHNLFHKCL